MCNLECEHCFVYGKPSAKGTFTYQQIIETLEQAEAINTIQMIYFEGGEPFLFYPLMLEGIKTARQKGFRVGVVTNGYFATTTDDALLWLEPLLELEISDLSISPDLTFHYDDRDNPAETAIKAARSLNLPVNSICIEKPAPKEVSNKDRDKGKPIVGGPVMFRGRAVEKLTPELPLHKWQEFIKCPYENLLQPERVHIDAYGNVQLCQGLSIGSLNNLPLSLIMKNHTVDSNPICNKLIRGGPALLAQEYNLVNEKQFVDACHLCYHARLALINRFPQYLAPRQVYGLA